MAVLQVEGMEGEEHACRTEPAAPQPKARCAPCDDTGLFFFLFSTKSSPMEQKNRTEKRGHVCDRSGTEEKSTTGPRTERGGRGLPFLCLWNSAAQHGSPEGWICSSKDGSQQLRALCFSSADLQMGSKESKSCSHENSLKITKLSMLWKEFIPRKQDLRQRRRSGRPLQKASLPAGLLQGPPAPPFSGMVPAGHQEITHR